MYFQKVNFKIAADNRGSFTVEATVMIAFLTLVITTILFLSFFLYHKCAVERAAAMAALRGSQEIWEDQNGRYGQTQQALQDLLSDQLLENCRIETLLEIKGNEVTVTLQLSEREWEFSSMATKKAVHPVNFIRNCKKLEGAIKE